jgi:UDP-N-acetylmuramyl pentapeptide phosphotransferase/UDP-N-acetylglucosamine-1-phosphate transferase
MSGPQNLTAFLIACACFVASVALVYGVREFARNRALLDRPNHRSAHRTPTPRLGGVGIVVAFLASALAVTAAAPAARGSLVVLVAAAVIAVVGIVDDVRPLRARTRFAVQIGAAVVVVALRWDALPGFFATARLDAWLVAPFAVLWIVWMTNLYNFMDGIDGLAGGQAAFAGAGLALGAFALGAPDAGFLLVLLVCASAGFLVFNFPPASIFMGDVGSTAIGFFLACVPFLSGGVQVPFEAVWVAVGLFVLDATTTLLRRISNGERWFEAHRTHWYQRPLRLGVPHRTITIAAYGGMAVLAGMAWSYLRAPDASRVAYVLVPLVVFTPFAVLVDRAERGALRTEDEANERKAA